MIYRSGSEAIRLDNPFSLLITCFINCFMKFLLSEVNVVFHRTCRNLERLWYSDDAVNRNQYLMSSQYPVMFL